MRQDFAETTFQFFHYYKIEIFFCDSSAVNPSEGCIAHFRARVDAVARCHTFAWERMKEAEFAAKGAVVTSPCLSLNYSLEKMKRGKQESSACGLFRGNHIKHNVVIDLQFNFVKREWHLEVCSVLIPAWWKQKVS